VSFHWENQTHHILPHDVSNKTPEGVIYITCFQFLRASHQSSFVEEGERKA